MRDFDVRQALRRDLDEQHRGDGRTRIVEEMGIWAGSVRVDIAVINGELSGYEIKSARDTLARLPAQQELYSQVFDRVTLVVADHHSKKASALIPDWWGVMIASMANGLAVRLQQDRPSYGNPGVDALQVARLLWRPEAVAILERHGLVKGFRSVVADKLYRRLASELPIELLRFEVRGALKERTSWLRKSVDDQSKMSVGVDLDPLRSAAGADARIACDH
ncbi:sce7726 family protein [Bradyrhizobium glycinis]|uniref:sce7726 family protein n=1 Tax=Bradyrhizobium glycinis TaxID=2751812 RepID=UPI0018D83AD4|nr:sce7726 family protein [Bradyrhizobium glycinis]